MRINVMPEIKSCSVAARVIAYALLFVPVGYLAVAVSFAYLAFQKFDHRFIAMVWNDSGVSVQAPTWVLSAFAAVFCVYATKVTWSFFTEFRNKNTFYVFKRAMKESRKEMKLSKTPNFDDFLEALGDESPKPRKGSMLRLINDRLPW